MFARFKIFPLLLLLPLITSCNPFSYGTDFGGISASFSGLPTDGARLSSDGSKIVLTWSAAINPEGTVHYFIYGDADFTELLDTTDATYWTFNNPVPGETYIFGVRARDDNGFDTNIRISVVNVSLNAPTFGGLVSASATSSSKIQLSWVASPTAGVTGYKIYLSRDLTNAIDTTTSTQYFVTGLTASTTYSFVVRAVGSNGVTDQNSTVRSATTYSFTVPEFSGATSATTMSGSAGMTQISVAWGRAGGSVTGYQVYYSTTSAGQNFSSPSTPQGANTGNVTVGPYVAGVTTTSAIVDGLTLGTTYYFVVRAFYWDGSIAYTEGNTIEVSATTLSSPPPPVNPTVTAVSPSAGQTTGGTFLTITGTGFQVGATVETGAGNTCAPVVVSSATSLTCTTVAVAAGVVDVIVTNPDTGVGTLTGGYTFTTTPAPTVSSITPTSGAVTGSTAVTVTGTGYITGATVKIGGSTCTSPTVVNATTITCTTSSHAAGSSDVVVYNPDTQYGTLASGFSYVAAPTVTSVSPTVGALAGGTTLTVTGTNFRTGATINIGGSNCPSVVVQNSTTVRCTTPAHSAGIVSVTVTNTPDNQYATLTNSFTYQGAPTVTSHTPSGGALAGGGTITINGGSFATGATVTIGGSSCTGVTVQSSGQLTCTIPAHSPGTVDVIVTNLDNQFGTLSSSFTYRAAPTVTSITPQYGLATGNQLVTIVGTGFQVGGSTVDLGGAACAVDVGGGPSTSTTIYCTTSARAPSAVNVIVTNSADSQTGTLTNGYHYTSSAAPTLSAISPSIGTTAGGSQVTITGTGFSNPTVTIGTAGSGYASCGTMNVVSQTELTCYPGVHATGTVDVIITNDDTQTASLTSAYQYIVLNHQGWSDVRAVGAKAPVSHSNLATAASSIRLDWNAFAISGAGITSYNIYRATTSGGQNYSSPLATGISTASPTYTDTTAVAGTTYYYVVRAVVSGTPLPTSQTYSEIKVIAPPTNMVLVHRWIANQEMCATLQRTADPTNNYRCSYTGPGGDGTYYDVGRSTFVDAYEMGCNYTPAPGCADAVNGCVSAAGAPGGGVGNINDVFYDRSTSTCYLKTAGSTWKDQSDATLTIAQRGLMTSNEPGLPPIVGINQARAYDTCTFTSISGFSGTKRLLTHKEQIISAAWSPSKNDATITAHEGGASLPSNGYCNTNYADGVTFDNLTTPSDPETIAAKLAQSSRALRTGSDSTENCISRYGVQDLVGNVWEWSSDQLGTCSAVTHTCTGTTSNLDVNNSDWSTINFDGTIGPGGGTINSFLFSAQTHSTSNFLVTLGIPMVTSVAASFDAMQIGILSGQYDSTKFHNNTFYLFTDNSNGAPKARAAVGGGSYDFGGGRYDLYIGNTPTSTFNNVGFRCALPAD